MAGLSGKIDDEILCSTMINIIHLTMNISPIDYVHILQNTFLCDRFNHSSRDLEGSCKYLLWKAEILRVMWPTV